MISRLSTAYTHGAVDIPEESLPRRGWVQSKFTQVYLLLSVVALVTLATFIVVLITALNLRAMGDQATQMTKAAQSSMQSIFAYPAVDQQAQQPHANYMRQSMDQPSRNSASHMEEDRGGGFLPVGDPPPSKKSLPNPEPPEVEVATVKYRPSGNAVPPDSSFTPATTKSVDVKDKLTQNGKRADLLVPSPASLSPATTRRLPRLPPGMDPIWFQPENLPNLLKLANALHIDLSKLPPEYQDLLPKPINATVVRPNEGRETAEQSEDESIKAFAAKVARSFEAEKQKFRSHSVHRSAEKNVQEIKERKEWFNPNCAENKCEHKDMSSPPLVILSLDGFARDYLDRKLVPTLDRIADCGARAEFVYSSFPSRTFPNHYTIVTGVYPESHGIVDNFIYDPDVSPELVAMKSTKRGEYFKAEPIWSLYKRFTGRKTACLHWVGCDRNITEYGPDYGVPYVKGQTFQVKTKQILDWLSLPKDERPNLITAYIEQPDEAGHWQRSDSDVDSMLEKVDGFLDLLMQGLDEKGLLNCINLVILSDHGMQRLTKRVYLDEHFPVSASSGVIATRGVVARVHLNGTKTPMEHIMADFRCSGGKEWRVYTTSSLPARYHFAATRLVGDVIFEGQPGTTFYPSRSADTKVTADHGYDYLTPSMKSIFFARGPSIRLKSIVKPFQNIEYYNLFGELLEIPTDHPTNGTRFLLDSILIRSSSHVEPKIDLLSECPQLEKAASIPCCACSEDEKIRLDAELSLLPFAPPSHGVEAQLGHVEREKPRREHAYCLQSAGRISIARKKSARNGSRVVVESLHFTPTYLVVSTHFKPTSNCTWRNAMYEEACEQTGLPPDFTLTSLMADENNKFFGLEEARVPLHNSFVKNFFGPLQSLTRIYLQRYGKLLSYTGSIFDYNTDGLADEQILTSIPSHIFRVLLSCREWRSDVSSVCTNPEEASVLAFVLPHIESDFNCLETEKLLLAYTARLKDIELMTGLQFFSDRRFVPADTARQLRTFIMEQLW